MVKRPIVPPKLDRMAAARAAKAAKRAAAQVDSGLDIEDEIDTEAEAAAVADQVRARRPGARPPAAPVRSGREPRAEMRKPLRPGDTTRDEYGRIAALSRDGEILSRKVTDTGDKFYVSEEIIPEGWTYQWIESTVIGQQQKNSHFFQNGWRPVPSSRHDGLWMAPGYKGAIEHEGLTLVERPKVLTEDARNEELGRARSLLRTQNDQFKPKLPGARSVRGTGLTARRTIEGMPPDVGRPEYEIAADDGLV
jgi:hypothetical protein